jgi:hypothetical protein
MRNREERPGFGDSDEVRKERSQRHGDWEMLGRRLPRSLPWPPRQILYLDVFGRWHACCTCKTRHLIAIARRRGVTVFVGDGMTRSDVHHHIRVGSFRV